MPRRMRMGASMHLGGAQARGQGAALKGGRGDRAPTKPTVAGMAGGAGDRLGMRDGESHETGTR